jgi:hypothetical protein
MKVRRVERVKEFGCRQVMNAFMPQTAVYSRRRGLIARLVTSSEEQELGFWKCNM